MSTQRQQILNEISIRLLQIRPGHTFQLPDGPYVCRSTVNQVKSWRKNPYQLAELPAIAYRDGVVDIEPGMGGENKYYLKIIMAAYLQGTTASSKAREILQDMAAALGSDPRCSRLAERVDLEHAALDMYQGVDIVAGARLALIVTYVPAYEEAIEETILEEAGDTLTW